MLFFDPQELHNQERQRAINYTMLIHNYMGRFPFMCNAHILQTECHSVHMDSGSLLTLVHDLARVCAWILIYRCVYMCSQNVPVPAT